jgi:FAD/FMN-containing dehydrogenase
VALGLGAFGVITAIELALVPTYNVANYVFEKFIFPL